MVWPVEDYTGKIHMGVKATMATYSHLSFTLHQLRPYLERGYSWLKNLSPEQSVLLDRIITTALAKLVQSGQVKKVTSKVQVERQWQWSSKVAASGYTDITSQDEVATTNEAKKAIKDRAIGARELWVLNGRPKLTVLH